MIQEDFCNMETGAMMLQQEAADQFKLFLDQRITVKNGRLLRHAR